jgi:SAM-dependent methyltransferase
LGLKNIAIQQGDLSKTRFEAKAFDAIVCHGVFSWVPKAAQDAILRICGESLAPNGIAAISYNVFPGWHMRRIVRDICLFHARAAGTPKERVDKARKALTDIAEALGGASPYAMLLRNEAQRLAKQPSGYVLGEFLAPNNTPCYYTEFVQRSAKAGLAVACDGEVATALPEFFFPSAARKIHAMSGDDASAVQQYTDFFSGRPFRRSLLVRAERAAKISPVIDPQRLRGLHFAANIRKDAAKGADEKLTFVDVRGRTMTAKTASVAAILDRLARAYPSTLSFDELLGSSANEPATAARALSALLAMVGREQATASAIPLRVSGGPSEKPCAWPIARIDAMARQPWVTGQHHLAVKMAPQLGILLPILDGKHDRAALLKAVGEFAVQAKTPPVDSAVLLDATLAYAARNGLLI